MDQAVCPESTIESANRRNFIKKAALVTAAASTSAALSGPLKILPESSASSANCVNVNCVIAKCSIEVDSNSNNSGTLYPGLAFGCSASGEGISSARVCQYGNNYLGLDFYTNNRRRLSITNKGSICVYDQLNSKCSICATTCYKTPITGTSIWGCGGSGITGICNALCGGGAGVVGESLVYFCNCVQAGGFGCGVHGISTFRTGVHGEGYTGVYGEGAIGLAAKSTFHEGGTIGLCAQSCVLPGRFKNNGGLADKTALIQIETGDSSAIDWNLGVAGSGNAAKVADGTFYFQRQGLSNIPIAINKCGYVGINNDNPIRRLCITGRIQASCGVGVGTQTINTTLAVNGSIAAKTRAVSGSTTLVTSDFAIFASGTITLTLPPASTQNGMMLFIKKTDSSSTTVTIKSGTGDSIEGQATKTLSAQYSSYNLISNGSHEWFIIATGT